MDVKPDAANRPNTASDSFAADVTVARVAATLLPRVDDLAAQAWDETRSRERSYRTLVDADDPDRGRCGVGFVLRQLANSAIDDDRVAPELLGRKRAEQGVPLEAVLHAFRIDFRTVLEAMLTVVRDEGQHALEPFVLGITTVWEAIDAISVRVSSAYREAESLIAIQREERRERLLTDLLESRGPLTSISREVAQEFGFSASSSFVLVVIQDQVGEQDPFRRPETLLKNASIRSAWRTIGGQQIGLIERRGHDIEELLSVMQPLLTRQAGISPEFHRLSDARDNLWLAEIASRAIPAGEVGITSVDYSLPASFAAAAPELAQYSYKSILGPLDSLRAEERERLLQALSGFLDGPDSLTETANALHIHRNTLFSYLRRVAEITGKDPHRRRDIVDLGLALAAYRLYGPCPPTP
jgi:hypothetical protein